MPHPYTDGELETDLVGEISVHEVEHILKNTLDSALRVRSIQLSTYHDCSRNSLQGGKCTKRDRENLTKTVSLIIQMEAPILTIIRNVFDQAGHFPLLNSSTMLLLGLFLLFCHSFDNPSVFSTHLKSTNGSCGRNGEDIPCSLARGRAMMPKDLLQGDNSRD